VIHQGEFMMLPLEYPAYQPLQINDSIDIYPFGGRKFRFNLKRTLVDIIPEYQPPCDFIDPLRLPREQNQLFHYQLTIENWNHKFPNKGIYCLKTKIGDPFLINGQWTKECFIEKDDTVFIGNNRLVFQKRPSLEAFKNWGEHEVLSQSRLLESQLPLLIEGETGTGKSHLARKVHEASHCTGEFIHLNLSSLSPSLIESELFGHKKGSFTGAISDKMGAFKRAHQGTLFLDEIDSLSLDIQTKLLLFFDDQKIRPVGSQEDIQVKTRVITASGKNLQKLMEQNLLRKDLFFRLTSGFYIHLKPLRDQPKKIKEFIEKYSFENHIIISQRLCEFYGEQPWPGNLRQLKGHLDLKREMNKGKKIDFDIWDEQLLTHSMNLNFVAENDFITLEEMKEKYIKKVLQLNQMKISQSAKILKISPRTLVRIVNEKDCK
jgi:transcriptional regulator with AAA-type ATPase domain